MIQADFKTKLTCSILLGLKNSSSCTPCTEGYYCKYPGWTNETALCQRGYYCPKFSTSSRQSHCPTGRYCPRGSPSPRLCPTGTFSNITELWMESQCRNCTPGYYCDSPGESSPSGRCMAGYYCPVGSKTMKEVDCPIGFHCPEGIALIFDAVNSSDLCESTVYRNLWIQKETCFSCTSCLSCSGEALYIR